MAVLSFTRYKIKVKERVLVSVWGELAMTTSAQKRTNLSASFAIMALSAVTMLWLFWHFPLGTGAAAITVLSAFALSARLARWIDSDGHSELERGKRGV